MNLCGRGSMRHRRARSGEQCTWTPGVGGTAPAGSGRARERRSVHLGSRERKCSRTRSGASGVSAFVSSADTQAEGMPLVLAELVEEQDLNPLMTSFQRTMILPT